MISVNDLRNGTIFEENGQLYQVLSYEHIKMGRGSGNIKVQVKSLQNGAILEKGYVTGAKVQEALIEKKKVSFLYKDEQNSHFMDITTYEQFVLDNKRIGQPGSFLKEGSQVELVFYKNSPIDVVMPRSVELSVAETGPSEKGNSVSNVYKSATLENGLAVSVPLFVKTGDKVKVDTRTGKYLERL